MDFIQLTAAHPISIAFASLALYTAYGIIWRLYLSPISHFPGPKLAALTYWYEFCYDVFPNYGQYTFHIGELHKQYGPIIRLNPYELHISTPQFYETLYSSNKKRDKWYWFTKLFGLAGSVFSTVDHAKHRERRAALNPFFSVASARRLQPVVEERVQAFVERMRGLRESGEVIKFVVAMSAFGNDVIMMYAFGRHYHCLEQPDFDVMGHDARHGGASLGNLMKHMYFILWTIRRLPDFVVERMSLALAGFVKLKAAFRKQVLAIINEQNVAHKDLSHPTVFHEILHSKLSPEDKSVDRLTDEAQTIVIAGSETVAWAMTVATYHLLSNPHLMRKLKTELAEAIPDPDVSTSQTTLEQLPYLTGVVKEALRLSYGVCTRLQRVPYEDLSFEDWIIPAGTPVGMTSTLIHHDESIFPNSKEFQPERWIEDSRLDRYLVSFSKGSRQCVGMNLAYAEMYLWLSGVFRRFGSNEVRFEGDEGIFELVDTTIEDVEIAADCFVPNIKKGREGVRVRVLP